MAWARCRLLTIRRVVLILIIVFQLRCIFFFLTETLSSHEEQVFVPHKLPSIVKTATFLKQHHQHNKQLPGLAEICKVTPGRGHEGKQGYQVLSTLSVANNDLPLPSGVATLKSVLCIVLTNSDRHEVALRGIAETYAPNCDGFIAASNATDPSLGAIDLWSHFTNITERLQLSILWNYVYDNYRNDYDLFHLSSDDTYVIPENLRYQLTKYESLHAGQPIYVGLRVAMSQDLPSSMHCSGGAGYTVNREGLQLIHKVSSNCLLVSSKPAHQALAECLKLHHGVNCTSLRSEERGNWVHHDFGAQYSMSWYRNVQGDVIYLNGIDSFRNIMEPRGVKWFSEYSISFRLLSHRTNPLPVTTAESMRRMHAIMFGLCDDEWETPKGALDASGNAGYVHDPTYVRNHPLPFSYHPEGDRPVCDIPFGHGSEGMKGYEGLQKIKIMEDTPDWKRIMCLIYTHSNRHGRIRAIAETFGPRCDGFMAASNLTDPTIGAVNLLHEGPEVYGNMWSKVRSMWMYVYDHYIDDYDFFHIGGDDTYLIAENLRYLVSTGNWKGHWNHSKALYLGGSIAGSPYVREWRYCGGGGGYTLNKVALKLLIEDLFDRQTCWPHWEGPEEDIFISSCFRRANIKCMDTNDHLNEARYHALDADFHANWTSAKAGPWIPKHLKDFHGIVSKEGLGQISATSVSFHLKDWKETGSFYRDDGIRRYHAMLYGLCDSTIVHEYSNTQ